MSVLEYVKVDFDGQPIDEAELERKAEALRASLCLVGLQV